MRTQLRHAVVLSSIFALAIHPAALARDSQAADKARLVIDRDFPDPDVLEVDGTHYAFATNSATANVQVATTTDPSGPWQAGADALPAPPPWVGPDEQGRENIWAPDVSQRDDGRFLLYFTAHHPRTHQQCIGAAVSDDPAGPFTPTGPQPLICDPAQNDVIDPASFVDDDGSRYLLYKDARQDTSAIRLRPVAADGVTPDGPETELLRTDRPEEHGIVEAPTLVSRPEGYVLLFSGNTFDSGAYFTNYATSTSPRGPFTKAPGKLLDRQTLGGRPSDPGGQDLLAGQEHVLFHGDLEEPGGPRGMFLADIGWDGLTPVLTGENAARQRRS